MSRGETKYMLAHGSSNPGFLNTHLSSGVQEKNNLLEMPMNQVNNTTTNSPNSGYIPG